MEEIVIAEERDHVRVVTLNRPRLLNVISSRMVSLLAEFLETWEKDGNVELILVKGAGRAFSAGGDLKMFYDGRLVADSCLEVVYRMYWLCYHIHSYQKTQVALVHGIAMGGGSAFSVPLRFSVVTEKTLFAVPEVSIGFHTDCSFSYILSHLPGYLGEFLGLTGTRLSGNEMVKIGLATHFVPYEKILELEQCLIHLNSGDADAVRSVIERFTEEGQINEDSFLQAEKLSIINKCFAKETVEGITEALELEANAEEGKWIAPLLKGLRSSSPSALKITLRSIREGRSQTLSECLKKEFRLTINMLRSAVYHDLYEGIRSFAIDKDNGPKWDPSALDKVKNDCLDFIFRPFEEKFELQLPAVGECRWMPKYENSVYAMSSAI